MRIEKFPVYVNGEPYKIILKKKTKLCHEISGWYTERWYRVKFYLSDKLFCEEYFDVDTGYGGFGDVINYQRVIEEAVKMFEKKLHIKERQRECLESLDQWDGK